MRRTLAALLFLGSAAATATAQQAGNEEWRRFYNPDPDCTNWGDKDQTTMNVCSGREADALEQQLIDVWSRARELAERESLRLAGRAKEMGRDPVEPSYFASFASAQRGWLAYREGTCTVARLGYYGGSIAPLIGNGCRAEMTRERIAELEEFINPKR